MRSPNWFGGIESRPFGARGHCSAAGSARVKGGYSLSRKRIIPFKSPKRKVLTLQASSSKSCDACRLHFHSAAKPRCSCYTICLCFYYPLLRSRWRLCCLTDAAHPLQVPLCPSCRSTAYFPSTASLHNAASAAMPLFRTQSAAEQTSLASHGSKARLRVFTNRRRFMAKPCTPRPHCAARAVLQATDCQCAGSRGNAPRVLLGVQGGYSLT